MYKAMSFIPPLALVAGLSLGAAGATLLWQGPMEHRLQMVKEAQAQTDEALRIAKTNLQSVKSLTAALKKCTALLSHAANQ